MDVQAGVSAEVRLRLAQDAAGLGLWEWHAADDRLVWDDRAAAMVGAPAGGVEALSSFHARVHEDDLDRLRTTHDAAAAAGGTLELEVRVHVADAVRVVFVRGQVLPGDDGRPDRVLGAVLDVTQARSTQAAEAEYARRLSRLATVSLQLAGVATVEELVEVVIERGLAVLGADGGSVCVRDDDQGVVRLYATRSLPDRVQVEFGELPLDGPLPGSVSARTGETILLPDRASGLAFTPAMQVVYDGTGRSAWAVVPLRVDRRLLGSLVVAWTEERSFPQDDLDLVRGFAAQCAQSLDRVLALQAQHEAALAAQRLSEALQRSLLTRPPQPDHLEIAVRYAPASEQAQVGGDWYDAFLGAGSTVLVIGDVNGHDRDAAATMGQVRNLLRGLTVDSDDSPATLLRRLDAALQRLELDTLATAVLARVVPVAGGGQALEWSNAGHLPPLLLHPDGDVQVLDRDPDLLLGMGADAVREDARVPLPDGATLLLYTDGLVERRGEDLDVGIRRLQDVLRPLAGAPVERLCDEVLAQMLPAGGEDDVALLAVQPQALARAAEPERPAPVLDGVRLDLAPEPSAVGRARRHVSAACAAADVPGDVRDSAVLLTSELVTNAILHGRSAVRVVVRAQRSGVRVEVGDDNSRLPEPAQQVDDALDGRGLAILEMLSTSWGAEPDEVGKVVWFEVAAG